MANRSFVFPTLYKNKTCHFNCTDLKRNNSSCFDTCHTPPLFVELGCKWVMSIWVLSLLNTEHKMGGKTFPWKAKLVNMYPGPVTSRVLHSNHTDTHRRSGCHPNTTWSEQEQQEKWAYVAPYDPFTPRVTGSLWRSRQLWSLRCNWTLWTTGAHHDSAGEGNTWNIHACCWCCTEMLRNIKQSEPYCQTNQCSDTESCLWRRVHTRLHVFTWR